MIFGKPHSLYLSQIYNLKFWLILLTDIMLVILSLYLAYAVRFETLYIESNFGIYSNLVPVFLVIKIPCFYLLGLYRGMWRYTSTSDVVNIFKASVLASGIIVLVLLYFNRFEGLSRSIFLLDNILTFLFITAHRIGIRFFYKRVAGSRTLIRLPYQDRHTTKLLLVGAGDAAEKVIREIKDNPTLNYKVRGLVDDNPGKVGKKIHGIPILGLVEDLHEHARRIQADEILIAIVSITGQDMKRLVTLCEDSSLPYKVLPGMGELIDGKVSVSKMREINYRDLLGRKEVKLFQEQIGRYLSGKTILVTGSGGSIGSELCRQITHFNPKSIILFDASEENLYNIQMELLHECDVKNITPVLGKVQDLALVNRVFEQHKPSVVFHAAAFKHVPLIENNPWQAVDNNIIGTRLVIEASILHRVTRFVLVSTDKAVKPANVMGASKRVAELFIQAYSSQNWDGFVSPEWNGYHSYLKESTDQKHQTTFLAVRFGNVLGSSGSVIPLFKKQISSGGPVTVTHPEITRYFMSIDEAAQLIVQAGSMEGEGGEIFILKMGEPVKIDQMARDLIELAGKTVKADIEIVYTGLREGEKLYEELITEGEGIVETTHSKIMVLRGHNSISCRQLNEIVDLLVIESRAFNQRAIKDILKNLLPEYSPL